jgi:DNA-binding response OmpR family regulator
VVDDEEAVCAVLDHTLRADGYEVVCAPGDGAAYAILEREGKSFDALVLDVNLGRGTTGFDIARFARGLNAAVPVIYISGGDEASVEKFGVPGSTLVAKPLHFPLLLSTLREKLG